MKGFILLLICAIVALIIVGGALGYSYIKESDIDSSTIDKVVDKVNEIESSNDNKNNDGDIVSEEVKFNAQAGEGYYREVTYKDGGFRQYDVDTGELIGSSYDSDQQYLPSMDWLNDFKGSFESFPYWRWTSRLSFGRILQWNL